MDRQCNILKKHVDYCGKIHKYHGYSSKEYFLNQMICQMICQSVHFGLNWPNLTIEIRNYNNLCHTCNLCHSSNRPSPRFETNCFFLRTYPQRFSYDSCLLLNLFLLSLKRIHGCSSIIVEAQENLTSYKNVWRSSWNWSYAVNINLVLVWVAVDSVILTK